jgi:N-acetyltransferase
MSNLEPRTLEGKHIQLVPLSLSHLDPLCEVGLDPELWRLTSNEVLTWEDMFQYIQTALADQWLGASLPFVIVEKEGGKIVGSSRYHSHNTMNRRIVIGHTWIARRWQRTAVNTEAKYLMLGCAFEDLQCVRVEFIVNSINEPSRRALLRIGAQQEGMLRNYVLGKDGAPCDVALFSIINAEWPNIKADLHQKLDLNL